MDEGESLSIWGVKSTATRPVAQGGTWIVGAGEARFCTRTE